MSPIKPHIPIYQQFIDLIKSGLELLDQQSQREIKQFVMESQNDDGGFVDRGQQPDLYYSLFGFWLASALKIDDTLDRFKTFIHAQRIEALSNPVDRFSLILIQQGLFSGKQRNPKLLKQFFRRNNSINFSYRLFLFLLVFDARYGKKRWLKLVARAVLSIYKPPMGAPSSMLAALMVARHEAGLKNEKWQRQLLEYFDDRIGFKAFVEMEQGDMLSMGVTLFAFRKIGYDLRLIAPTCIEMIELNYEQGAFLSGDGDQTRDLEYTFYGLLALGSLALESELRNQTKS